MKILKIYGDKAEGLMYLSNEAVGQLVKAMITYQEEGTVPELTGEAVSVWCFYRQMIDANIKSCEQHASAGRNGGIASGVSRGSTRTAARIEATRSKSKAKRSRKEERKETKKTEKEEKLLKNGNKSLYLDVYVNGIRSYEMLHLYIIPEKTAIDKERNKATYQQAETHRARRILELQSHKYGTADCKLTNKKQTLLDVINMKLEVSEGSSTYKGYITLKNQIVYQSPG